jgi:hypothetical protein
MISGPSGPEPWTDPRPAEAHRHKRERAATQTTAAGLRREELEREADRIEAEAPQEPRSPVERRLEALENAQTAKAGSRFPGDRPGDAAYAPGAQLRRDAVRRIILARAEDRREESERSAGLPDRQRRWDRSAEAITARRHEAEQAAEQAYRAGLDAARVAEARERSELGERPTLESLQAVSA